MALAHCSWCRPDSPGCSQGTAAQLSTSSDCGAAHRAAFRLDHLDRRNSDLSSEILAGPPHRPVRDWRAGLGSGRIDSLDNCRSVGRRGPRQRSDRVGREHAGLGADRARGHFAPGSSHHGFLGGRRMRRPVRAIFGNRRSWRTGVRTVARTAGRSCRCSWCSERDQWRLSFAFHRCCARSRPRWPLPRDADLRGDGYCCSLRRQGHSILAGSNSGALALPSRERLLHVLIIAAFKCSDVAPRTPQH